MSCLKRPPDVAAWRRETPPDFTELRLHFSKPRTSTNTILKILIRKELLSNLGRMKMSLACHYGRPHDNLASRDRAWRGQRLINGEPFFATTRQSAPPFV
jgi:hypothetical protein